MKKGITLGAVLFILGICAADSSSIIPTIIFCVLGSVLVTGSLLCEKKHF